MGLFAGLGRLLQGKPVFEVPDDQSNIGELSTSPVPPVSEVRGPKIIPEVEIERSEYHNSGSHMRLTCHIKNRSSIEVELDKIRLLGTMREIDRRLRPGESYEFVVFDGERPRDRSEDDAYVIYKTLTGDYFESHHRVEFREEKDRTFFVHSFHFVGPVKDLP